MGKNITLMKKVKRRKAYQKRCKDRTKAVRIAAQQTKKKKAPPPPPQPKPEGQ